MIEDAELLRRYAVDRSEAAFAELVQRHLGLVYSVALRQVERDAHLAEDVAQKVFADLARKAGPLSRHPVLSGWLYRSTQFTAIDVMRSERRRRAREQEAQTMQALTTDSDAALDADKLRPVLDQVMGELNDRDRDAVMLRFFEGRPFAEVGRKLRLTEDAARMRVERAVDKMRTLLVGRGVTSTTAALAAALAGQAGLAAPAGLAASVTGGALAGTGSATAIITFMSMTKLQLAVAGVLLVAGGSGFVVQQRTNDNRRQEIAATSHASPQQIAKLQEENQHLAQVAAEVKGYRTDAAEIARLRDEAGALARRFKTAATPARGDKSSGAGGGSDPGTIYDISQLERAPKAVVQPAPTYPFEMRRAGIGGTVTVTFIVDQTGGVSEAHVSKSTRPEFEESALEAVKKWKFQPGQKDGLPVGTKMVVPMVFSFSKDQEAWF